MRHRTSHLLSASSAVLATVGIAGSVASGADTVAAPAAATAITVAPDDTHGAISPLLLGGNGRWAFDNFGGWDPEAEELFPEYVQALRDTGLTTVRYPGGTIANLYRWKQAIGPQSERVDQIHGSTRQPLDNHFGPDEYGRVSESLGHRGSMVVNFNATPREAADWVEYMTGKVGENRNGGVDYAQLRARNGHPKPYDLPYWEVGNEMSNNGQLYWRGGQSQFDPVTLYANGGSTTFTNQRVGKPSDHRNTAAVSDGSAHQSFVAEYAPVTPGTATVYVDGEAWQRVENLGGVGAEQVYTLNEDTGRIRFGNGKQGAVPPDESVVTISYTSGPHAGFDEFYATMKQANPDINICAGLSGVDANTQFAEIMGDSRPYDCLAQHNYVRPRDVDPTVDVEEYHGRFMLQHNRIAAAVAQIQQAVQDNAGERASEVSVVHSEYGHLGNQFPVGYPQYHATLSEALLMANNLIDFASLGVPMATRSNLVDYVYAPGPPGFGAVSAPLNSFIHGPGPDYTISPQGLVPNLFRPMVGGTAVGSTVIDNPARILDSGQSLPALTTLASRSSNGDIDLLVVNVDIEDDVTATVQPGLTHDGSVQVQTLSGPSILAQNLPGDAQVELTSSTTDVGSGEFTYTFPAHSVTRLHLTSADR